MNYKELENRLNQLEKENKNLNFDLENLDIIHKKSSCNCNLTLQVGIFYCKDCKNLKNRVEFLEKTLTKFTMGKSNLDILLKCIMDGYGYSFSQKQKYFKEFSFQPKKYSLHILYLASIV